MGTAMGLAREAGDAPFALCYKQIAGMQPTVLTESEIASVKALNANVYITRGLCAMMKSSSWTVSPRTCRMRPWLS